MDAGGASIDGGLTVVDGGASITAASGVALAVTGVGTVTSDLTGTAPLTVAATSSKEQVEQFEEEE